MAFSWRTTAFMSCALNFGGGGWRGGNGGELLPEISWCGLQVCCASSMGTGCWRVHAYRRQTPINSCTTSSPTLGSTELSKIFEVLRLDKEVSAEQSSGGPLPSSRSAVEKVMKKVCRAAERCRLTDPISTGEPCRTEYEDVDTEIVEGARGSRHMAGARVNGLWYVDASGYGRDGSAILNIDNKSSLLLERREVSMDVEASNTEEVGALGENLSFSRIGGGDGLSIEDIDENHYQDSRAALTNSASKDDFWPAVDVKEMLAKGQAIDKVNLDLGCLNTFKIFRIRRLLRGQNILSVPGLCAAFDQGQQHQSAMQDPEKRVDDRHFNRCIHHLLAVLSLPRVTTIDKETIRCEPEQVVGSRGGVKTSLEAFMDDVVSITGGSDEFHLHKPFLHLWNGFWVGPDDEDGWGFVEALVSPVDIDGPVCWT